MSSDLLPEPVIDEIPPEPTDVKAEKSGEPMWNINAVLLLISLLFLTGGCVLLFLEFASYGYSW